MKQLVLNVIPRPVKKMAKDCLQSNFKWRYIDNFKPLLEFKVAPPKLNNVEKKILSDLNDNGVAVSHVSHFLSTEEWEKLQKEYKRLETIYQDKIQTCRLEVGSNTKRKNFLYSMISQAEDLSRVSLPKENPMYIVAHNAGFKKIADCYFGMFSQLHFFDFWLTFASNSKETRSQLWHRDVEDKMLLKGFIYLNDVNEGEGPFTYAKNTHLKGDNKKDPDWFYEPRCGQRRATDDSMHKICNKQDIVPVTGKAGDIIFADTRGLHKGGIARTGDRKLFKFEFSSKLLEPI